MNLVEHRGHVTCARSPSKQVTLVNEHLVRSVLPLHELCICWKYERIMSFTGSDTFSRSQFTAEDNPRGWNVQMKNFSSPGCVSQHSWIQTDFPNNRSQYANQTPPPSLSSARTDNRQWVTEGRRGINNPSVSNFFYNKLNCSSKKVYSLYYVSTNCNERQFLTWWSS